VAASYCPTAGELASYHTGRLTEAAETLISAHVDHCVGCEAYLDQLDSAGPTDPMIESLSRSLSAVEETDSLFPIIPGYVIEELLGRGGMGQVYRARQLGLDRVVALKMLSASAADDPELRQRFRREATDLARLRHPHVVTVYDVGEVGRHLYFSMEYCADGTLAQWQAQRPQPPREAAELMCQITDGVAAAHAAGIVHRDLKPANILVGAGKPLELKISDFGIARRLDSLAMTQSGIVAGTPNYMAPEQISGIGVGFATDIHALGAILFELLTGRPVFIGADVADTFDQIKNHEPIPPSQIRTGIPRDLTVITLKCLQKEPRLRYGSAEELASDLRRFLRGEAIHARPTPFWVRSQKWARRHPARAATALAFLLIVVGIVTGVAYYTRRLEISLADTRRAEQIAAQNAHAALGALDTMVYEVQDQLKRVAGGIKLRNKILEAALGGLEKVVAVQDPKAPQLSAVSAWYQISLIQWSLGQGDRAKDASDTARKIAQQLVFVDPHNEAIRARLAETTWLHGCQHLNSGQRDRAREIYEEYVTVTEDWIKDDPKSRKGRWQLGRAYESMGHAAQWVRDFDTANAWFAKMQANAEQWRAADPDSQTAMEQLARCQLHRGTLASDRNDAATAKTYFDSALSLYEQLARKDPKVDDYSTGVQTCHYELGMLAKDAGDLPSATEHSSRALAMVRELATKRPDNTELELQLIDILFEISSVDRLAKRQEESLTKLRECRDRLMALDKAGKLANRPVYSQERRQQVEEAIVAGEKMAPTRR
jgi:eukaryotic-like serine/threonine-protein kinase